MVTILPFGENTVSITIELWILLVTICFVCSVPFISVGVCVYTVLNSDFSFSFVSFVYNSFMLSAPFNANLSIARKRACKLMFGISVFSSYISQSLEFTNAINSGGNFSKIASIYRYGEILSSQFKLFYQFLVIWLGFGMMLF